MKNPIPFLRKTAYVEALSFLLLLGIAMPLKYLFGMPGAVRIAGSVHGIFFVAFCVALLQTTLVARWSFGRAILVFASALIPFGPFLIGRRIAGYEAEFAARP